MIVDYGEYSDLILSGVDEPQEFTIKSSARSFAIMSSNLYSDKIFAIIRELSCNAWDSHIAAGKTDVPFVVHLPNALEPWFSVKDFGVGLSFQEIHTIYTTYYDSTKTTSNNYTGALGLGSKSPFSYVKSFTITAIQNGVKRTYAAFINARGVPSIADMGISKTDEENGVEVKFAVDNSGDFGAFCSRAQQVYAFFPIPPIIEGRTGITPIYPTYAEKDIIPGVHLYKKSQVLNDARSYAIMGCVAYPIALPLSADITGLASILQCPLEMHFGIGELDIQASREGLSYDLATVATILNKLHALQTSIYSTVEAKASSIENIWTRMEYLKTAASQPLYKSAVAKYAQDNPTQLFDSFGSDILQSGLCLLANDIKDTCNIKICSFTAENKTVSRIVREHTELNIDITNNHITFVVGDTKDAVARAKYHARHTVRFNDDTVFWTRMYVLIPHDTSLPMDCLKFFDMVYNPPLKYIMHTAQLTPKPTIPRRANIPDNVTILELTDRSGRWGNHADIVWEDAGKLSSFNTSDTFYYVPLRGYQLDTEASFCSKKYMYKDAKTLGSDLRFSGIPELVDIPTNAHIYGVRKSHLKHVKRLLNWINVEEHIKSVMENISKSHLLRMALNGISSYNQGGFIKYAASALCDDSPYKQVVNRYGSVIPISYREYSFVRLNTAYSPHIDYCIDALQKTIEADIESVIKLYPLLPHINNAPFQHQIDYVKMVDKHNGIFS